MKKGNGNCKISKPKAWIASPHEEQEEATLYGDRKGPDESPSDWVKAAEGFHQWNYIVTANQQ